MLEKIYVADIAADALADLLATAGPPEDATTDCARQVRYEVLVAAASVRTALAREWGCPVELIDTQLRNVYGITWGEA